MEIFESQELDAPISAKKSVFTFKSVTGTLLLLLLSAVFFYSGFSKIHNENAFDNFQWTFLDLGINSLLISGIIARIMIGFEFLLGLFLLFHLFLKAFTYKAIIATLSVFIIYLLFVLLKQGNKGDCGCFGDQLAMSPLAAIIKNVAMIAVTVLLMYIHPVKPYKYSEVFLIPVAMLALVTPFLLNMMSDTSAPVAYKRQIDLNLLYKYPEHPDVELRQGKHIVAFMSLTCPHCKKAAYLLQIIHREHPDYPIYMVLDGNLVHKKAFFDETHAIDVPHLLYYHTDEFVKMAGNEGVPAIYWINNGATEYKSQYAYYQLDPKYMKDWLTTGLK